MKSKHLRYYSPLTSLAVLIVTQTFFQLAVPSVYADTKPSALTVSPDIVISQVYGGGGNSGSVYKNDFVELFNREAAPVSVSGWSVQYASTAGSSWAVTNLTAVSIPAGGYYLIQEAAGAGGTTSLPAPDATGSIAMAAGAGKIALVTNTTALTCGATNNCTSASIKDFVGYGTGTSAFEGVGPTPTASATNAVFRAAGGCTDSDNNAGDFTAAAAAPRNSSSPTGSCGGGSTNPSGVGLASPNTVLAGGSTLLTVTVTNGTNPTSTGVLVVGDLSTIGGSATQAFFDDGSNGDVTPGDNIFSFQATVAGGTGAGNKTLVTTITDAQARSAMANIGLTVTSSAIPPSVVGAASPNTLVAGNTTLLTATVTPGSNPVSTGLAVVANLTSIGGSATQMFFDDGSNGDATPGDNVFSYSATVAVATSAGVKSLPTIVSDAQARTGNTNIALTVTAAPPTGQPLPFTQNWTNTGLITANNDWSGVPGIVGYLGDFSSGSTTGVDPQTLTDDFATNTVSVLANQADTSSISGGVGEFELANTVVGFQGSGTADAPHIVISLNTTGASNVTVSYNLSDIDGSADNSVQPVALQYRVGASGSFTNVPSAFVADASSGPNLATLVTPVAVLLPAAVDNQTLVQLRIITTNAVGSDEWIGIDDIDVESNGTIPLSASGSASPNNVEAGNTDLLTVTVNPATNPLSTGIAVTGDLSSISGSATQQFFDDGTNGDVTPGDNIFSYSALVPVAASSGNKTLPISITDAQMRTASTSIGLIVSAATDPQVHLTMGNPSNATVDVNVPSNYLLLKNQYVESYNRDRGEANWVSWHLDSSWIGTAPRQDDFRPDPSLPAGWYQVNEFDFSGSGFDRGHHCPSGDRTRTIADNSATFFMTNMMAQSPDNNQGPWEKLESDARVIAGQGNELYIIAGGVGTGGTGSNGGISTTIASGHVTVPAYTWKVIIILPSGDNDVSRVTTSTRTIAVIMPNVQGIFNDPWQKYIATVDQVEDLTGYDFFSNVPVGIQAAIESHIDAASNTNPQTIPAGMFTNLSIDAPTTTLTGNVTVTGNLNLGGSYLTTGSNRIILGPNATVTRTSGKVIGNFEKQFDGTSNTAFTYPLGTANGYSPMGFQLTSLGTSPSSLTVSAVQGSHPNAPDPTLALQRYWVLTENGDLSGNLTFYYLEGDRPDTIPNEATLAIKRYNGSTFDSIPTTNNIFQNTLTTISPISDFSDWTAFGTLVPTAAGVTVSGRVVTPNGFGVRGARVRLIDGDGNVLTTMTSPFGYYSFDAVRAGQTYIGTVVAKGYTFQPKTLNVGDSLTDINFQSNENWH